MDEKDSVDVRLRADLFGQLIELLDRLRGALKLGSHVVEFGKRRDRRQVTQPPALVGFEASKTLHGKDRY